MTLFETDLPKPPGRLLPQYDTWEVCMQTCACYMGSGRTAIARKGGTSARVEKEVPIWFQQNHAQKSRMGVALYFMLTINNYVDWEQYNTSDFAETGRRLADRWYKKLKMPPSQDLESPSCYATQEDSTAKRFRDVPAYPGLRRFNNFSTVKQWTGVEQRAVSRQLIPVIAPLLTYTIYRLHDGETLRYMELALYQINQLKWVFSRYRTNQKDERNAGHFNFPKFHSIAHYPEFIRLFGTTDGKGRSDGSARDKIKASSLAEHIQTNGLLDALAVFVREMRNKHDGKLTLGYLVKCWEEDPSWISNYIVQIHPSMTCWKSEGKDPKDHRLTEEIVRCSPNWQGKDGDWRRVQLEYEENGRSAGASTLNGKRVGQLLLIVSVRDHERQPLRRTSQDSMIKELEAIGEEKALLPCSTLLNFNLEEAQFGILLQLSDDDSSDEDYNNFWKDQKVIVANRHRKQMSILLLPVELNEGGERSRQITLTNFTPTVPKKQTKLSLGTTQAAPTVTQAAPVTTPTPAAPVDDDEEEELLLDSLVAGATGLDEITTEPLTAREVNELATKLLPKGGLPYRQQQDLDLLQMYSSNISKEGEFRARKVETSLLIARACREWLLCQRVGSITIDVFHRAINDQLLPRLMAVPRRPIGRTTTYRRFGRLGFFQSWEPPIRNSYQSGNFLSGIKWITESRDLNEILRKKGEGLGPLKLKDIS
ncbi:hypothetical protein V8E54_008832 [Elaphomyces granulatus]